MKKILPYKILSYDPSKRFLDQGIEYLSNFSKWSNHDRKLRTTRAKKTIKKLEAYLKTNPEIIFQ